MSKGRTVNVKKKGGRIAFPILILFVSSAWVMFSNTVCAGAESEDVVFQQDLEGVASGTSVAELGWKVNATPEQSVWQVKEGYLEALFHHNPYKGGNISTNIPVIKKGYFQFDAWIGDENNQAWSLSVTFYGIATAFHGYGPFRITWNRYAEKYIDGTPADWMGLTQRLAPSAWHTFRIVFDAERNFVEYYADNMDDPVGRDTRVPVLEPDPKGTLIFSNYGMSSGDMTVKIDNIKLVKSLNLAAGKEVVPRNLILVINGVYFGVYKIPEALGGMEGYTAKYYSMEIPMATQPKVLTSLSPVIGTAVIEKTKLIIMADASAECIDPYAQEFIAENVRKGASLLVLGGLFTYGKGHFKGSKLEELLPVVVGGPWEVKRAEKPLRLRPAAPISNSVQKLDWEENPALLYYHDLTPKQGSEVWLTADEQPVLIAWKVGKGTVVAFTGAPIGKMPEGTLGFWQWKDWPKFLSAVIRQIIETKE